MPGKPPKHHTPQPARLTVSRQEASERITTQIEEVEAFLPGDGRKVTRDNLLAARKSWSDYTYALLKKLFTTDGLAGAFDDAKDIAFNFHASPAGEFRRAVDQTRRQMDVLWSIQRRLEFYEDATGAQKREVMPDDVPVREHAESRRDVFIVHGHDEGAKQGVVRFLEKLKLNPIILHEEADRGRTIIQKFEDHSDVRFAVVLLTPDDEGRARGDGDLRDRARQNVILELGYFIGRLGRRYVCALKSEGVEELSDLHGLLYIPLDSANAWHLLLAKELKAAGFDIDMNEAI